MRVWVQTLLVAAFQVLTPHLTVTLSSQETQFLPLSDFFIGRDLDYEARGPGFLPHSSLLELATFPQSPPAPYRSFYFDSQYPYLYVAIRKHRSIEVWRMCVQVKEHIQTIAVEQEVEDFGLTACTPVACALLYWVRTGHELAVYRVAVDQRTQMQGIDPFPSSEYKLIVYRDSHFLVYGHSSNTYFYHYYQIDRETATRLPLATKALEQVPILDAICTSHVYILTSEAVYQASHTTLTKTKITAALGKLLRFEGNPTVIRAEKGYWYANNNQDIVAVVGHLDEAIQVFHGDSLLLVCEKYEGRREATFWELSLDYMKSLGRVSLPDIDEPSSIHSYYAVEGYYIALTNSKGTRLYRVVLEEAVLGLRAEAGEVQLCAWEHTHPSETLCIQVDIEVENSPAIFIKQGRQLSPVPAITRSLLLHDFTFKSSWPMSSLISGANLHYSLSPLPELSLSQKHYEEIVWGEIPAQYKEWRVGCSQVTGAPYHYLGLLYKQQISLLRFSTNSPTLHSITELTAKDLVSTCTITPSGLLYYLTASHHICLFLPTNKILMSDYLGLVSFSETLIAHNGTCISEVQMHEESQGNIMICEEEPIVRVLEQNEVLVVGRSNSVAGFYLRERYERIFTVNITEKYVDFAYWQPYLVLVTMEGSVKVFRICSSWTLLLQTHPLPSHCSFQGLHLLHTLLALDCLHFLQIVDLAAPQREAYKYQLPVHAGTLITATTELSAMEVVCDLDLCRVICVHLDVVPTVYLELSVREARRELTTALTVSSETDTLTVNFTVLLESMLHPPAVHTHWSSRVLEIPEDQAFSINLYDIFSGSELNFSSSSAHISPPSLFNSTCPLFLTSRFFAYNNSYLLLRSMWPDLYLYIYDFSTSPCQLLSKQQLVLDHYQFESYHALFTYRDSLVIALTGYTKNDNSPQNPFTTAVYQYSLSTKENKLIFLARETMRFTSVHIIAEEDRVEVWGYQAGLWCMQFTPSTTGLKVTKRDYVAEALLNIRVLSSHGQGNNRKIYFVSKDFLAYEVDRNSPESSHFLGKVPFTTFSLAIYGDLLLLPSVEAITVLSLPQLTQLKVIPLPEMAVPVTSLQAMSELSRFVLVSDRGKCTILLDIRNDPKSALIASFQNAKVGFTTENIPALLGVQTYEGVSFSQYTNFPQLRVEANEGETVKASNSRGEVEVRIVRLGRHLWLWVGTVAVGIGCYCYWKRGRLPPGSTGEIELRRLTE